MTRDELHAAIEKMEGTYNNKNVDEKTKQLLAPAILQAKQRLQEMEESPQLAIIEPFNLGETLEEQIQAKINTSRSENIKALNTTFTGRQRLIERVKDFLPLADGNVDTALIWVDMEMIDFDENG